MVCNGSRGLGKDLCFLPGVSLKMETFCNNSTTIFKSLVWSTFDGLLLVNVHCCLHQIYVPQGEECQELELLEILNLLFC